MVACRLRPVEPADVGAFFAHQDDAEAAAMAGFPMRDRSAHDAHWQRILADPTVIARTIVECDPHGDPSGDLVAGNVVSFLIERHRLVGYWLGRDFWGRGLATAALRLFLREVPQRPLHAQVAEHNRASLAVLARCGFEPVGRLHYEDDDVVEIELVLRRAAEP